MSLARDSLATASAWVTVGLAVAFVAVLLVLVFILIELRGLSRGLQGFLGVATDRSRPLIDSANSAAKNVDYIIQVVRADVDRVNQAFSGTLEALETASLDVQGRVKDVTALMDLAQSEAEDAVLDAATRVRALRAGVGALSRVSHRRSASDSDPPPPSDARGKADEHD